MARLEGRAAVVTGAGQGLGRAYAQRLASEGASVLLVDKDASLVREAAADVPGAVAAVGDVTRAADMLQVAQTALDAFGRIDILVNNAGGSLVSNRPFDDMPEEDWDLVVDVNLKGQWLAARAVAPTMRRQRSGKIINIASATLFRGLPVVASAYIASKAGVVGLTRALARELGAYEICVNAVSPGQVIHRIKAHLPSEKDWSQMVIQEQCLRRPGTLEDLTGVVAFLASDDSNFMTGQVLNVDGGWALH